MTARWCDHACRHCGGRLLETSQENGVSLFECGTCSITSKGAPDAICGCGIIPKPIRGGSAFPRFYCTPNPARCVASPAAIVIVFGEKAA